jgi:energy-coupling factor transporter ATP-binding protein EcfA2
MTTLIDSLKIYGFRGFSELTIPTFGKVNLITGKNNAGKSSLLEAIRILVTRGSLDTIQSILNYREENNEAVDHDRDFSEVDFGPYRNLFTGLPDFSSGSTKFVINASSRISSIPSKLSVSAIWAMKQVDAEKGGISYESTPPDRFGDPGGVPALETIADERRRLLPLDSVRKRFLGMSQFAGDVSELARCVYLDPFSSRSTGQLGVLWDAIALTDAQDEVVKALQLISPDIQAVSMIGSGESRLRSRTAIVRSQQFDSPLPLRTFGDGVNRLFGIVLSLCNARNGVLLIDEFENGLHHSVQTSIWKTIFRLASDLNVQVFATSHSQDCVRAFQEAATDSPQNDGVLIRLTRKGDVVLPTTFKERELEIVTQNEIEVR